MKINLHHIELFYYVAEAGGITQSLKVIPYPIQQPAISQQMISLEKALGVTLFERRPFVLTDAGRTLLATVAPFMEKLSTLEDELQGLGTRRLRIGRAALIADHYLPEILEAMLKAHPDVIPSVSDLEGRDPHRALIAQELDLTVSIEAPPRNRRLRHATLMSLPWCVIVPQEHPWVAKGEPIWTEAALQDIRWVALQEHSGGMSLLHDELRKLTLAPRWGAETNSIPTALKYIRLGLGLGFMPHPPAFLLKDLKLRALVVKRFAPVELSLCWREGAVPDDIAEFFLKECVAAVKRHRKDFPGA